LAGTEYSHAERRAAEYLPYARRCLPQYVEELEGMAEGSGQPFLDLLVPNCGEELTCTADRSTPRLPGHRDPAIAEAAVGETPGGDAPAGETAGQRSRLLAPGCTAVALSAEGRHLVGHNMDWYAVDLDKNVLFDVTGPDGTRFITIAGVPYLPILGLNSHGLGYVGNSLYSADARLGVPNVFVRRWVLDAAGVSAAQPRAMLQTRARGSNHLLADRAGVVCDIETSAGSAAVIDVSEGDHLLAGLPGRAEEPHTDPGRAVACAHTNHYAHPDMLRYEGYWSGESRRRLRRAHALLAEGLRCGDNPIDLVARVLRDNAGGADAICSHVADNPRPDQSVTVASMICDLDEMQVRVCAGPPCANPYRTYPF
jgi:isopenicillin-N N-acyltransferase-like protein